MAEAIDGGGMPVIPPRHLSDVELAAFIDGRLAGDDRAGAASHLAACADCRAELVVASRLVATAPARRRVRSGYWLWGGVAAAAAILAISILPRTEYLDRGAADMERRGNARPVPITAFFPQDGSTVAPRELSFSWHGEAGASYRITVTDESGGTIWSAATNETVARLPDDLLLSPDARYYWYVDALRADGSSTSSGPRSFSTRP